MMMYLSIGSRSFLRFKSAIALLAIGLAGCSDLGVEPDPMYATTDGRTLTLVNTTRETLHHAMFPTEVYPYVDWFMSTDPAFPQKLSPVSSTRMRYQDLPISEQWRSYKKFVGACTARL
jgi:hypothetical protein